MPADLSPCQRYIQQCSSVIKQLQQNTTDNVADRLFTAALHLTRLRLSADISAIDLWQQHELAPIFRQTEVLWRLLNQNHWPVSIQQRVLLAGFCAALTRYTAYTYKGSKLPPYPSLMAAKILASTADAKPILTLLNACYASERNVPEWRQSAVGILLTVSDYLSQPNQSFTDIIGRRIGLSRSEHELSLLRQLITYSTQDIKHAPEQQIASQVLRLSRFNELLQADVRSHANYLQQSHALSQPILRLASELNRQKQDVTDLKLALNLLGAARLPGILAVAELNFVLAHYHHPLERLFEQFVSTFTIALRLLLPNWLPDTSYNALALCISCPIWQHPPFWLYSPSNLNVICRGITATIFANSATVLTLLNHYQLTEKITEMEHWLTDSTTAHQPVSGTIAALQLALESSLQLFCGNQMQAMTRSFVAAQQAKLVHCSEQDWMQRLAEASNCLCPLELIL